MLNFDYSIATEIFFGKDQIKVLGKEIKKYGNKVLLVYGGGSIKKNGIYDKIIKIFEDENIEHYELSGVEPNPRIGSVRKGIEICRDKSIELILAVGGGSTIDCSKVIAAGYYYDGDAWDIVLDSSKITNALPLASVLTLAATGSEMDKGAVITNTDSNQKLGTGHPSMAPKFSILDPSYTFSVARNQTAAGVVDIMSHIFESYFSNTKEAYIQNRMAEAMLKTCINYGKKAMDNPKDYEARANLMWTGSLAINGLISYGKETEWNVHGMEHELSAFYDITHGVGLAILTPNWMEYALNENTLEKFVEYGVNVWDICDSKEDNEIAKLAIEKTREFFKSLEMPTSLSQVAIDDDKLDIMAKQAIDTGLSGKFKPLNQNDVLNIYKMSL